jgi:hypothetical protein
VFFFAVGGMIVRQIVGLNLAGFALFMLLSLPVYALVLWRLRGMLGLSALRQSAAKRKRLPQ